MRPPVRYYLPPVLWMGVIFLFSSVLFSSRETGSFLSAILSFISPNVSENALYNLNWVMRKTAHLTEYAILAVLLTRALALGRGMTLRRAALAAFVIAALYSVTDEFHQAFVPGRESSPYDAVLDSFGACVGAFLAERFRPRWIFGARPR